MKKAGIIGLAATLAVTIPLLFFITRGAVSTGQFWLITAGVLVFVAWGALYVVAVDPWLRRRIGGIFNVRIEQVRQSGTSVNWEPVENQGCLFGLFIQLIGYAFLALWLLPLAGGIILGLWLQR